MTKASRIKQLRAGVGTPEPKTVPVLHGGPEVAFELKDSEQVDLSVEALDSEGNPAAASTTWESSDPDVVAITDNGDGTAIAVASPGAGGLGSATITAKVTDNSDGDVHDATFDIDVVAGDATTFNIVAGTATPKAETPVEPDEG